MSSHSHGSRRARGLHQAWLQRIHIQAAPVPCGCRLSIFPLFTDGFGMQGQERELVGVQVIRAARLG